MALESNESIGLGRPGSRFQTSDLSKLLRDTTESAKNLPEVKRGQRSTKKGDKCTKIRKKEKKSKVITTLKLAQGQMGSYGVKRGQWSRENSLKVSSRIEISKICDVTTRI